jgi:3-deoxy-7-phosphoheptulonate synthase
MIVVMDPDAPERSIEQVIGFLTDAGFDVHRSSGQTRTILGVVGDVTGNDVSVLREFPAVAKVVRVSEPFRLASRRFRGTPTLVEGPWGTIGGERPWIAIEAIGLQAIARGGADQERDLGPPSTDLQYEVAAGRPFDAAVSRSRIIPDSVGALSCLSLHPQPAEPRFPVLFVERQPSWGANAWIGAADRELERREGKVVLLEAGGEYPNGARTLEVAAIARAKLRTHLPIVVDVPTVAQRARYCSAVACAAIGAGADGVVLRVWVGKDGETPRLPATLRWTEAMELADKLRAVGAAVRA